MRARKWQRTVTGAGAMAILALAVIQTRGQTGQPSGLQSPAAQLVRLNVKFEGAASCSDAKCHGAAKATPNGESFTNEFSLWSEQGQNADPHHNKTWEDLRNDKGKAIAKALGIANATQSERCLSCHSLSVPQNVQGKNFKLNEGVTCNACHGPSEKYNAPHSKKGWYDQERKTSNFEQLLAKWGLYDTRPVHPRAERCTSCHLAIEPDLVVAKHPQPNFEIVYFSDTYPNRHWHDPGGYFKAKLWAGGQQVALYDALRQLASRAGAGGKPLDDAYQQAMAHYAMFDQFLTVAMPNEAKTLAAAMAAVQQAYAGKQNVAAPAQAAADADAKLADSIEKWEPDKTAALKILNGVAGLNGLAKTDGTAGQNQQSYSIYALYSAHAEASKTNPDNDPVLAAIGSSLFPEQPHTADQYEKDLEAVRPKLPK